MPDLRDTDDLLQLTAVIAIAYVANNHVAMEDLPGLLRDTHTALANAGGAEAAVPERPVPAVPVRKSITQDHLVCLEDGHKFKMLKRHLRTVYDLSPDEYRARWQLPPDYPMVAPAYAKTRSDLARKIGLGTKAGRKPAAKARAAPAGRSKSKKSRAARSA